MAFQFPMPNVVPDATPGGPVVASMNALQDLQQNKYGTDIKKAEAQYAPYTEYANALSKIAYANMLPYQTQATVMSNPMTWMALKDNPDAIKAMMENFSNSIPRGNQLTNGMTIPFPNQNKGNENVFSSLINKLMGNDQSQSQMQQNMPSAQSNNDQQNNPFQASQIPSSQGNVAQPSYSPLVPATNSGMAGVIGKQTAPYVEQVHKPGTLFLDSNTGDLVSTPTETTVTAAQNSINAAKRVIPQLKRISELAAPFMSAEGKVQNQYERMKNLFFPDSKNPGKLPTQYAKLQSTLQSAPEALVKAYGLRPTNETIERMQKVIEPYPGETGTQYQQRILDELQSIYNEQISVSQNQIAQGFNVSDKNGNKSDLSGASKALEGTLDLSNFKSKEQFRNWYKNQPKSVQDAVRAQLKG